MSTTCGKDATTNTFQSSKTTREEYKQNLTISAYSDPFQNPENKVEQWITDKGPDEGKINQKIVSGPDRGVHRFITPSGRTGQTGITRFRGGDENRS